MSSSTNSFLKRRNSRQSVIQWADNVVTVGGDAPVRVQSMTNTDTADAIGTAPYRHAQDQATAYQQGSLGYARVDCAFRQYPRSEGETDHQMRAQIHGRKAPRRRAPNATARWDSGQIW